MYDSFFLRKFYSTIRKYFENKGPRIRSRIGKHTWVQNGTWAYVESSWVKRIRYDLEHQHLYVTFHKSGFTCRYPNVTEEEAVNMFKSVSMGRFVRSYLYSRSYEPG